MTTPATETKLLARIHAGYKTQLWRDDIRAAHLRALQKQIAVRMEARLKAA